MLDEHLASQPTSYSRPRFGRAQIREFSRLVALLAEADIRVDLFPGTDIIDMERRGDGWTLSSRLARWESRIAVLATGHWAARPPELAGVPYLDPWPSRALQNSVMTASRDDSRIGIVGSYLTAVDAALTIALAAGSFQCEHDEDLVYRSQRRLHLTLLSRHGRLPWVWPREFARQPLRWMNVARMTQAPDRGEGRIPIDALASLLLSELGNTARAVENPAERLLRQYFFLSRGDVWTRLDRSWRSPSPAWLPPLVASLPAISESFAQLDARDHLEFRTRYQSAFFNLAMPMARGTAAFLRALRKAGCLDVVAARDAVWSSARGAVICHWRDADGTARSRTFDALVNGRAGGGDIRVHPSQLIQRLRARGDIQRAFRPGAPNEPRGTGSLEVEGIHVDPGTCEVVPAGRCRATPDSPSNLYAMGPNVSGLFLDAQSVGHLMRDAERIINHLSTG